MEKNDMSRREKPKLPKEPPLEMVRILHYHISIPMLYFVIFLVIFLLLKLFGFL